MNIVSNPYFEIDRDEQIIRKEIDNSSAWMLIACGLHLASIVHALRCQSTMKMEIGKYQKILLVRWGPVSKMERNASLQSARPYMRLMDAQMHLSCSIQFSPIKCLALLKASKTRNNGVGRRD